MYSDRFFLGKPFTLDDLVSGNISLAHVLEYFLFIAHLNSSAVPLLSSLQKLRETYAPCQRQLG